MIKEMQSFVDAVILFVSAPIAAVALLVMMPSWAAIPAVVVLLVGWLWVIGSGGRWALLIAVLLGS